MYFAALFSSAGSWAADLEFQHIRGWIPLWCDKTSPKYVGEKFDSEWMDVEEQL